MALLPVDHNDPSVGDPGDVRLWCTSPAIGQGGQAREDIGAYLYNDNPPPAVVVLDGTVPIQPMNMPKIFTPK